MKEDVKLTVRKPAKGQMLTNKIKTYRLEKCRRMKQLSHGGALNRILFTDEKIFTVEPVWNLQNNRELLPKGFLQTVRVEKTHFPRTIMVWAGNSGLGKTKLVFVPKGTKLNAKVYRELILEGAVISWAERHAKNIDWWLQQDWARTHGAKTTLEWCEANLPGFWGKDIWLSNSPDLNPIDFYVWGTLEQKACSFKHKSIQSLERALEKAWEELTSQDTTSILKNFQKRVHACVKDISKQKFEFFNIIDRRYE